MSDEEVYFPLDFGEITPRDERVARRLANCFNGGPLNGKTMRLVGHADPRGSEGHNLVLGQRRADKVKELLVRGGIPANRIVASSRGKADAKGYDEATWALDRLVEISGGD